MIEATLNVNRLAAGKDLPQIELTSLASLWDDLKTEFAALPCATEADLRWEPVSASTSCASASSSSAARSRSTARPGADRRSRSACPARPSRRRTSPRRRPALAPSARPFTRAVDSGGRATHIGDVDQGGETV